MSRCRGDEALLSPVRPAAVAAQRRFVRGPSPPSPGAFRGFVLAINCRDVAEVDRIYGELNKIDGVSTVPSIREVD